MAALLLAANVRSFCESWEVLVSPSECLHLKPKATGSRQLKGKKHWKKLDIFVKWLLRCKAQRIFKNYVSHSIYTGKQLPKKSWKHKTKQSGSLHDTLRAKKRSCEVTKRRRETLRGRRVPHLVYFLSNVCELFAEIRKWEVEKGRRGRERNTRGGV